MKKKWSKRVLAWMLCVAMVISGFTGFTLHYPLQDAEAAVVSSITTPITENASDEDTTVWQFLWVLPLTVTAGNRQGDTLSEEDVSMFTDYIVPNFEACIYEYSNHYMMVDSTVITIESLEATIGSNGVAVPDSYAVEAAIKAGTGVKTVYGDEVNSDLKFYDHVACCFEPKNTTNSSKSLKFPYSGLGGGRFAGYKSGYSISLVSKGMGLNEENKAWINEGFYNGDGTMKYYYYSELVVHEFMHCMEFYVKSVYPEVIRREMPSPDAVSKYYASVKDLMNEFYNDFFVGAVPILRYAIPTFGLTVDDYKRPPSLYQTQTIKSVTINTLEDWNDLVFKVHMGADASAARVTFANNIDARGKKLYSLPSFSGTISGNGYAIIGASLGSSALIGTLEEGATIANLLLLHATVTNKKTDRLGLLVNENYGLIEKCGVSGTVTGRDLCGGIAGTNETTGWIRYCFNGATVSATKANYYVGGITGYNAGMVSYCYNYGMISSSVKKNHAAGICYNAATVDPCYTLKGAATYAHCSEGSVSELSAEELAGDEFATNFSSMTSNAFEAGNGYPAIKGTKYAYMTTGGSSKDLVTESTEPMAVIWANGASAKLKTVMKATKWVNGSNKKVSGSLVWLVKNEPTEIAFNTTSHKVLTKSDTSIATVSKGVVKGKKEGRVYVYAIDTGTMSAEAFVVQVKAAPTAVRLYYDGEADPVQNATAYTSDIVPAGGSIKIYYKGTTGSITKTANTMEVLTNSELTYSMTVPSKYKNYITYEQNVEEGYFEVAVKDNAMDLAKRGKAYTVSLTITNDQSKKKGTFKLVVSNPVKNMTLSAEDENTKAEADDTGMLTVTMNSAKAEVQTASIKETLTLYAEANRTDSTKILRIPCADGYTFSATSGISVVGKTSSEQNKVSLSAVTGKTGVYKITAKKGTQPGTEAYFLIYHNGYERTIGKGYQIVKVVVGEANHASAMELTSEDGASTLSKVDASNYSLTMNSAKKKAVSVILEETIELETNDLEGTDYNLIYRLPCAEGGFSITTAKTVVVNGALSSAQKKVNMSAVKGKAGQYKITAAKGTPEGTEAYFLLFHNPECYSVITVTVGTTNKVTATTISTEDSAVTLTEEALDSGKMTTIVMQAANKAAKSAIITEIKTLPNVDAAATDVSKIVRIKDVEAFIVALNQSTVSAIGSPTSAQKKVSIAAVKGKPGQYKITAKKGTPIGTEAYFILYHNYETAKSGAGYRIIKIVVGQ